MPKTGMNRVGRGFGARLGAALHAVAASLVFASLAAPAALASDLEIISTQTFESNGKKYLQPCVHNNAAETRHANFRIGNGAVRWRFKPMPVAPGATSCFTFDAAPLAKGIENRVELE